MPSEPAVPELAAERPLASSRPASSGHAPFATGGPLLALLRPFALVAVLALLVGRVLGPSVPGIAVGVGKLVYAVQIAGDFASQLLALGGTIAAMAAILVVLRARVRVRLRVAAVVLGGFVVLATLSASGILVSRLVGTALAAASVGLALLCAAEAARAPFARVPAAAVGLMALAGAARVVSVYLAYRGAEHASAALLNAARAVATAAFVADGAAVALAAGWLGIRRDRLVSPALLAALALALVLTRAALASDAGDGSAVVALLRGIAGRLASRPQPAVPVALIVFVAFFAPIMALAGLSKRSVVPALSGCLALLLVVRSSPERPLCALLLVVASLGLALTAADGPLLWSSLPPPPARGPSPGPESPG